MGENTEGGYFSSDFIREGGKGVMTLANSCTGKMDRKDVSAGIARIVFFLTKRAPFALVFFATSLN